jgi:hypothetical protein
MKDVGENRLLAHQPGQTPPCTQALQPDISNKVWYAIAWMGGALFTSILAPLIVDFIKLRIGLGRHRLDSSKPAG